MTHLRSRTFTAAAITLVAAPVLFGVLLLRGRYLLDRRFIELDPFELDLQLRERNDDA